MNAKDLVVDYHTQRQEIEHVGEIMPYVGITVLSRAFCIKSIGLSNAS